jgi:hypothetical protein
LQNVYCEPPLPIVWCRGRRIMLIGTQNELASLNSHHLVFEYGPDEIDRVTLPSHDPVNLNLPLYGISAINGNRASTAFNSKRNCSGYAVGKVQLF